MVSTGHKYKQGNVFGDGIVSDLKIFIREARDPRGKKRPITVRSWSTIKDVKDKLQLLLHVPPSAQRLFVVGPLYIHGRELPNHRTLQDAGIYKSGETLLLDIRGGGDGTSGSAAAGALLSSGCSSPGYRSGNDLSHDENFVYIVQSMLDSSPKALKKTVHQAMKGFVHGFKPELMLEGSGGTYLLHGEGKAKVGVFKPADEEPYAENNPRGYVRTTSEKRCASNSFNDDENLSLRAGIVPGEACLREVAAFLLDHDNFSSVPNTTLVVARHPGFNTNGSRLKLSEGGASVGVHSIPYKVDDLPVSTDVHGQMQYQTDRNKIGSFQEFISAECSMDDLSPSKLSVDEVHKIAILDIRMMNADRNSANLLCVRRRSENGPSNYHVVPIDHGYCLRNVCDVCWFDWCWLDWPQLKKPLSERIKNYIINLDIEADVAMLRKKLLIDERALDIFRASSKLLQVGVRSGLRLYDIALSCCRHDDAGVIPSRLELLTSHALELATSAMENGKWHHTAALRALTEQLFPDHSMSYNRIHGDHPEDNSGLKSALSLRDFTTLPQITHLSGSDSSSDAEEVLDNDQEECRAWAALVAADYSIDLNNTSLSFRKRSLSINSEISNEGSSSSGSDSSGFSGSQQGFWHIHPGHDKPEDREWPSSFSPLSSRNFDEDQSARTTTPEDTRRMPESQRPNSVVRFFNDDNHGNGPIKELSSMSCLSPEVDIGKGRNEKSANLSVFRGLTRSQSYSAFHSSSFREMDEVKTDSGSQSQVHREYAVKFVDLLIEREIVAAARLKKQNYVPL